MQLIGFEPFLVITIPRVAKTADGRRVYDKRHYCLFCCNSYLKVSRHILDYHADEDMVKCLFEIDKDDEGRRKKLDYMRFKGDYLYNLKTLRTGGELVVWRRPAPTDLVNVADYIPCQFCLVFITKSEMWRHHKTCDFVTDGISRTIEASKLLLFPNQLLSSKRRELKALLVDKMKKDDISAIVIRDELILDYGSFQLENGGLRKMHSISERLRLMARVLRELRQSTKNSDMSLENFIRPEFFDNFVECTKALGGYAITSLDGEPVASFSTPSVPLKIGYTLSKCAELLRGKGIKTKNPDMENAAESFMKLFVMEWSQRINVISHKTLNTNRFEKVQLLPVTEDLLKLREYLKVGIRIYTEKLSVEVSMKNWRTLAEILGTRVTIFNRRRSSEVFQILISRYNERNKWKDSQVADFKDSLTPLEQKLMNRYYLPFQSHFSHDFSLVKVRLLHRLLLTLSFYFNK